LVVQLGFFDDHSNIFRQQWTNNMLHVTEQQI
jgi:hypothetical protein